MASNDSVRSVKIGSEESTGWSSDRPIRAGAGRPPRPQGRAMVRAASDQLSFPSGSLVVFTGADPVAVHRLVGRLLPRPTVIPYDQLARAVAEKVGPDDVAAVTMRLVAKAATERLAEGQPVVIETAELSSELRTALAKLAAGPGIGSHLVVLDSGRKSVADDERFETLRALATAARSGDIGSEGFSTVVVLGRSDVDKVTEVEFTQRKR